MKWSGSKNSQSKDILKYIPKQLDKYYEPFTGGGSIFLTLLENEEYDIKEYFISDFNEDLINIYNLIKNDPNILIEKYKEHYINFNNSGMQGRKDYFNKIRKIYNETHDPCDFYWIMRTTTNGMPRYNRSGGFNNSCHFTRPGMKHEMVEKMVLKYSKLFNENNIHFNHNSYCDVDIDGFMYLDPPYENTKGMYFGMFDNGEFIKWLNNCENKWILSYDGKKNDEEIIHVFPKYETHKYLESGNSSFRRILTDKDHTMIHESIYMNF
tara:strand:+ start:4798 stop:5598 length:801 start_codon:yes stop_codon:yes gene_type:complete